MSKKFKGTIELDIRDSVEDWDAFTQPNPPKGSPNVIILLWDDTGIATWDIFGGLVKVPNMKRLAEKGIRWQICYGLQDDLVEPETALAPLDYVQAEVAAFPKGHVAIATSWSNPDSAYALHTRFDDGKARGPVRFHLDLQEELDAARAAEAKPAAARKAPAPKAAAKRTAKRAPKTRAAKAAPKARARRS